MGRDLPRVCIDPRPCGLLDAIDQCHVRSSVFRVSNPGVRYPKNHFTPLLDRIPAEDQVATDWLEHDPREGSEQAWLAFCARKAGEIVA